MKSPERNTRFPNDGEFEEQKRKISKKEQFHELIDDHEEKQSLMGHSASDYDEGLALNYHEDHYDPHDISRVHPDKEIKAVILELLGSSQKIDARQILVSVDHSCVTLSGTVGTSFEKDYALSLVKLVHGVGEVKSTLTVEGLSSHVGG
jgi:osmotically-inducible protein OsmY